MTHTTTMNIYVKGEKVFTYVRDKGTYSMDDVEVEILDVDNSN